MWASNASAEFLVQQQQRSGAHLLTAPQAPLWAGLQEQLRPGGSGGGSGDTDAPPSKRRRTDAL